MYSSSTDHHSSGSSAADNSSDSCHFLPRSSYRLSASAISDAELVPR